MVGLLAAAQAGPPAPSLQLLTMGTPHEASAGDAVRATDATGRLLGAITHGPDHSGWFQNADWPEAPPFADQCGDALEAEACIRALFVETPARAHDLRARVVVLYRAVGDDAIGWTCIGVGDVAVDPEAQAQVFTTTGWDDAEAFWQVRLRAVDCVMAAARESGW